jgi:hypothetical protein
MGIWDFSEYELSDLQKVKAAIDTMEEILGEAPVNEDMEEALNAEINIREEEDEVS